MKPAEAAAKIPKIRVTCHKTGKVYEGYYFEMPATTYCFESDPEPETLRIILQHTMTDWGLPNRITPLKIDDEDEVEIIYQEAAYEQM